MNSNLTKEDVLEIIKDFKIEPIFNKVIITLNSESDLGLNLSEVSLSEEQYVIAGSCTYNNVVIKPGDKILLDLKALQKPVKVETTNAYETVFQIEIDPIYSDGKMFAIINDRMIKAKDNR